MSRFASCEESYDCLRSRHLSWHRKSKCGEYLVWERVNKKGGCQAERTIYTWVEIQPIEWGEMKNADYVTCGAIKRLYCTECGKLFKCCTNIPNNSFWPIALGRKWTNTGKEKNLQLQWDLNLRPLEQITDAPPAELQGQMNVVSWSAVQISGNERVARGNQ